MSDTAPTGSGARSLTWADGLECVGRCFLAALFIREGFGKVADYGGAAAYMARYGMPSLLLPAAIAIELGAGAMIVLGWRTRIASTVLALFCLIAAVVFHPIRSDRNQLLHFEKDLALAGAFLILAARGARGLSIDGRQPSG